MKKTWEQPNVSNLGLEKTETFHYHCAQCGRYVPSEEVEANADDWECGVCGGKAYGGGCFNDAHTQS